MLGVESALKKKAGKFWKFAGLSSYFGGGGAEGIRTPDPHNAIVVLYQLSYDPTAEMRR